MRRSINDPEPRRVEHRTYLYACIHCHTLNLIGGVHVRVGPRSGYWIEQGRQPAWHVLGTPRHRSTVYVEPLKDRNVLWESGAEFMARCARPQGEPTHGDLYWHEDAERRDTLCKGLRFFRPQLLKQEVATAMAAAGRLGGEDAMLEILRQYHATAVVPIWTTARVGSKTQRKIP